MRGTLDLNFILLTLNPHLPPAFPAHDDDAVAELGAAQAGGVAAQHFEGAGRVQGQMPGLVHFGKGPCADEALDAVFVEEGVVGRVEHRVEFRISECGFRNWVLVLDIGYCSASPATCDPSASLRTGLPPATCHE